MHKIINYLYRKYCKKDYEFELKQTPLNEKEIKALYIECKLALDHGWLERMVDMIVAESEHKQLYQCCTKPFQTTVAELEACRRGGIEDLMKKIKEYKRRASIKDDEKFDKHEAL